MAKTERGTGLSSLKTFQVWVNWITNKVDDYEGLGDDERKLFSFLPKIFLTSALRKYNTRDENGNPFIIYSPPLSPRNLQ